MSEQPPFISSIILRRDDISDWTQFPYIMPLVQKLYKLDFHDKVTFLVGENGAGKSTLLEAIAISAGFNPEGGSKNFMFASRPSHSSLSENLRLVRKWRRPKDGFFLRAETFYNVATEIERLDIDPTGGAQIISGYGGTSLHEQSHGEGFMSLMLYRFRANGLYILDEPEAALSPARQLLMLRRIHELVMTGCQFIIATHSPIIMAYPNATIYLCEKNGDITPMPFTETEHYLLTKRFLSDPDSVMQQLFDEAQPPAKTKKKQPKT